MPKDTADPETMKTAAGLLGIFLSSTDPNIRPGFKHVQMKTILNPHYSTCSEVSGSGDNGAVGNQSHDT